MQYTIEAIDPLEHEAEIKRLFIENDRPEFPEYFDRAYPEAVRAGASSWIGRDPAGRLVMHQGLFPHRFIFGDRELRAGLLVNLMVDAEHRRGIPAVALIRRLVADQRSDLAYDFLYCNPNRRGTAVTLAGGLREAGKVARMELPVSGSSWPADMAVRSYRAPFRLAAWLQRMGEITRHDAREVGLADGERPAPSRGRLRPVRPELLLTRRLKDYPTQNDEWFVARTGGKPTSAVLVRTNPRTQTGTMYWMRHEAYAALRWLAASIPPLMRQDGPRRIEAYAIVGSSTERALRQAGFRVRDSTCIATLGLTDPGKAALPPGTDFEFSLIDGDS